jgi:hypothetical protein
VAGWVTDSTRSDNFVDFLSHLVAQMPAGLDLHCIADNSRPVRPTRSGGCHNDCIR